MSIADRCSLLLENGRISGTGFSDLSVFFQAAANRQPPGPIVLHFHGGLVSREKGLEDAQCLADSCFEPAGASPLSFVWGSHPLETLRSNLTEIAKETIFRILLKHVCQFAVAKAEEKLGARGQPLELPSDTRIWDEIDLLNRGEMPFNSVDSSSLPKGNTLNSVQISQFEKRLQQDIRLRSETQKIAAALVQEKHTDTRRGRIQGSTTTLMSPSVLDDIRRESVGPQDRDIIGIGSTRIVKGAVTILKNVIIRFIRRRDHGFYPTIFEEILRELYLASAGKLIWDLMKKDTQDAFKGYGHSGADQFGGTALLRQLNIAWAGGFSPRIVLVGHGTGALFICNLLKAADAQNLPSEIRFDVVFIAPSVSFEAFDFVISHHGERIYGLRTFGMKDEFEQADKLLPFLYPRSMLYFVSGTLESEIDCPLLGMQRFYMKSFFDQDSHTFVHRVTDYMESGPNRLVWSICHDGPGLSSGAVRHKDFKTDAATLDSIRTILQKGFANDS